MVAHRTAFDTRVPQLSVAANIIDARIDASLLVFSDACHTHGGTDRQSRQVRAVTSENVQIVCNPN